MLLPNYKCLNVLVQSWLYQGCPNQDLELCNSKFHPTSINLALKITPFLLCPPLVLLTEGQVSRISNFDYYIFELIFHSVPSLAYSPPKYFYQTLNATDIRLMNSQLIGSLSLQLSNIYVGCYFAVINCYSSHPSPSFWFHVPCSEMETILSSQFLGTQSRLPS